MGMERWNEKCSLLIERCRAGRLSLLFVVQQSFRPIGSLGCVGCCIALCLSSQRNAIGFPARCVSHRSLSLLSLPPVLFVAVSFCCVSSSCFLVDFYLCPLVCVGMLSSWGLLSVRLDASWLSKMKKYLDFYKDSVRMCFPCFWMKSSNSLSGLCLCWKSGCKRLSCCLFLPSLLIRICLCFNFFNTKTRPNGQKSSAIHCTLKKDA